jgi:hypothetical protein
MSREDGFDVADVATGHLDDPKVKALWRAVAPDQDRMSRALTLHLSVLLASWRQGARVTVAEAVPVWLDPDAELVATLQAVGLLDRTGKLPTRSWKGWFGPAWERREARREAGRLGGMRSGTARRSNAEAPLEAMRSNAEPDRPTGRSVRTVRQDRPSRENVPSNGTKSDGMTAVRETVAALGLAK